LGDKSEFESQLLCIIKEELTIDTMKNNRSLIALAVLLTASAIFLTFQLVAVTERTQAIEEKLENASSIELSQDLQLEFFASLTE
jgi:hypothetical protein